MSDNFLTRIYVKQSRKVKDFDIPISKEKRCHLILTGKNGSGKTSLLYELRKAFTALENNNLPHQTFEEYSSQLEMLKSAKNNNDVPAAYLLQDNIDTLNNRFNYSGGTFLYIKNQYDLYKKIMSGKFILAFFDAKRHVELKIPTGINKVNLQKTYSLDPDINRSFIQYIVNLKADRSFARDDNDFNTVEKIDDWFNNLEKRLKYVFNEETLTLAFNRKTYNFDITIKDDENFNFNTLSDGYSAIISIITELMLRMEAHDAKAYDIEGIVVIDEIETHLHVELQKKILPFLTDFFPRIQFIVTTHSPFVLSSLSNAIICDLERKIITKDLSSYSYDAIIESYFLADKYSEEIKEKIIDFEKLIRKKNRTNEENNILKELRNYFSHSPKYLSTELRVKLQQLELMELTNNI